MSKKENRAKTLKMCVDSESWVPKEFTGDYKSVPKDELDYNSWWYLHGELESLVGYDKAYTTNCKTAGYSKESINWSCIRGNNVAKVRDDEPITRWEMHVNGIIPVKVKGVDEICVGYFWTTEHSPVYYEGVPYPHWEQRGLVCLASDEKGRAYAQKCYDEHKRWL